MEKHVLGIRAEQSLLRRGRRSEPARELLDQGGTRELASGTSAFCAHASHYCLKSKKEVADLAPIESFEAHFASADSLELQVSLNPSIAHRRKTPSARAIPPHLAPCSRFPIFTYSESRLR